MNDPQLTLWPRRGGPTFRLAQDRKATATRLGQSARIPKGAAAANRCVTRRERLENQALMLGTNGRDEDFRLHKEKPIALGGLRA